MTTLVSHSEELRDEADRLLNGGLVDILARYGDVHVIGSYALGLMVWRDLDIHIVTGQFDVSAFFRMGADITTLLGPHRMHFRDERAVGTPGLPRGLYWGVHLGDERAGAWKIDIWETDRDDFERVARFGGDIARRLDEETREAILEIKHACWTHPDYRRRFTSADIYSAVLDRGVRDVAAFWNDRARFGR
jgi:hypothetical protein